MSAHDQLVAALQAYVAEHGGAEAVVELLALTAYSVIAWHGLNEDPEVRAHGEAAVETMGGAVETLDVQCFQRRMRQCN